MHSILPWPLFSLPSSSVRLVRRLLLASSRPRLAPPLSWPLSARPSLSPSRLPRLHAHMQREPDRPAGTQSPLAPCISELVSQSVIESVSRVNRVARERAKGIIALSFLSLSLSLSLFFLSFSFSLPCTVCNYGLLSPLSFSLSLSSHSYRSPRSLIPSLGLFLLLFHSEPSLSY